MSTRVIIPLAKGFEETEAIAVIDILRRAEVEVVVAALEPGPVTSAHDLQVVPDALLADVAHEPFDAVVLPGGLAGTDRLAQSEAVIALLRRATAENRITAAICAAPTVLEQAGLLHGRRATCHVSKETELNSAQFSHDDVVVDGKIVTSRGVGTALAFGLELVSLLVSPEKARHIAESIHFAYGGTTHR
jgi:4-methyl-5(b-hydroxyethyl)-thiazole monophosphate biosynthesis